MKTPTGILDAPATDRLIQVLQLGFDDLARNQKEQLREQKEQAQRQSELFAPRPRATRQLNFGMHTKFSWMSTTNSSRTRYSTDLNTGLVFAGLFSAVDSAFIIQIQPQVQDQGADTITIVAQSLLYISLGTTLLAALLGVLGMQWLGYYSATEERGSIAVHGCSRQEKLDGLRKWKFDMVMQTFPLLLQFGLLLFSVALSVYLSNTHLVHAIIAIFFSLFGFIFYVALIISAVAAPHCPFQTPLARFIFHILETNWVKKLSKSLSGYLTPLRVFIKAHHLAACSPPGCKSKSSDGLPLFGKCPQRDQPKQTHSDPIFGPTFPDTSPEVPAVSWILESSTDPRFQNMAAETAVNLQWPSTLDLWPQLERLHDILLTCFDFDVKPEVTVEGRVTPKTYHLKRVHDRMARRAIHLGMAYCALRWIPLPHGYREELFSWENEPSALGFDWELINMVRIRTGEHPNWKMFSKSGLPLAPKLITWSLRVIPSFRYPEDSEQKKDAFKKFLKDFDPTITLDPSSFTDYLFCINSYLSDDSCSSHDMAWMDKSTVQLKVLKSLLKTLKKHLKDKRILSDTTIQILQAIGQLAGKEGNNVWDHSDSSPPGSRQVIINDFCWSLAQSDEWDRMVLAACLLTEKYHKTMPQTPGPSDSGWVFKALDGINSCDKDRTTIVGAAGLFNTLLHYHALPNARHIDLLLQTLKNPCQYSSSIAQILLDQKANWFQNEKLKFKLQSDQSAWAALMHVCCNNLDLGEDAIRVGHLLAGIPDWYPHIQKELCSWITIYFGGKHNWDQDLVQKYNFVLATVWRTDPGDYQFSNASQRALGLTFLALKTLLKERFNFAPLSTLLKDHFNFDLFKTILRDQFNCVTILHCINLVVLRGGYKTGTDKTGKEQAGISPPLSQHSLSPSMTL
ncbi:hypothetical protein B0H14DRAFT_3125220 [Mycena olivaceomarginata]|nr:hypothetical protein B0H14DRAFT_3125220 [Mycena olivaceomarginata]